MGYVLVAIIAKVLGRNPRDLWLSTTKWAVRVGLTIVVVILLAGVISLVARKSGGTKAPAPVVYNSGCATTLDSQTGRSSTVCGTPSLPTK